MKEKGKYFLEKKAGISLGAVSAIAIAALVIIATAPTPEIKVIQDDKGEWHNVLVWNGKSVHAEGDPGAGAGGFLSIFLLDEGQVPETVLANNATDWSASGDVHAYDDADEFNSDVPNNDPFYIVVRVRFNATQCKQGGTWNHSRVRAYLTTTGDEAVGSGGTSGIAAYNGSDVGDNDCVISAETTDYLYVNFYWNGDASDDGFNIDADGGIDIANGNLVIQAKY